MKKIDLALKELKPEPAKAAGKGSNARALMRRYALKTEERLKAGEERMQKRRPKDSSDGKINDNCVNNKNYEIPYTSRPARSNPASI